MHRWTLLVAAVVIMTIVASCHGAPGAQVAPTSSRGAPEEIAEPEFPSPPVDPRLIPISRSEPSSEARAALDMCVRAGETDLVAGMAQVPASDVRKYMLTNGNEPELQDDTQVWAIQLRGRVEYRSGVIFHPLCVVRDGQRTIYAPYGGEGPNGRWAPPEDFDPPEFTLPALLP